MPSFSRIATAVLAAATTLRTCLAQEPTPYKDPETGIEFGTWVQGDQTIGLTLPEDALTKDANEYIGYLKCAKGWCGVSHGQSGQMTQALLIVAWPHEGQVLTSFRFTSGYTFPDVYAGDATITQISSKVTDTGFELIYRCQNCFSWDHEGSTGSVSSSGGFFILGHASANTVPSNPQCPAEIRFGQHQRFGQFGAPLAGLARAEYPTWAALATKEVKGECDDTNPPGPTDPVPACNKAMIGQTFDYIVVGAGAGGIPIADRLSEKGHRVLLVEKGPPSTGRWGGSLKPLWLEKTDLTRFDVPGLCNQIWVDSDGIACTDTDQMAGCVLGGGTAVNAGLWWKANPKDWDENFPRGWKNSDLRAATDRTFKRIPGTTRPSQDGELYMHQGFDVIANGLEKAGWKNLPNPNNAPTQKNHTFGSTTYMFAGGERGGPLATYLTTAAERANFALWMNTPVRRALRSGSRVTGVELGCTVEGGAFGTVNVTPNTGRVIVSAGTFGSAKFLFRSGIGPNDQLEVVANSASDGKSFIAKDSWINLPVGHNLVDHVNTDTYFTHPDVVFYDFYEAWTDPIEEDKNKYLSKRSGILAQAAPNIGPVFWDEIKGADGVVRQLQWTARVEGEDQTNSSNTMIMSQYLGRGQTSRGRMTIQPSLTTIVSTPPYLRDPNDKAAVIQGIENIRKALSSVTGLEFRLPTADQSTEAYVDGIEVSAAKRRANHWMGTAKLGTDDGRKNGGTAVVDTNTRVYGTDNLFVVDGSIFPGMVTGNPSAMIVAAAEHASDKILALSPRVPAKTPKLTGAQILSL
uniref:Cellobiose dehydrogenase n=1 Tax=Hypoxylon haematostroma TaxID=152305 RepID=E7D6C3_9PEZI|nr:cellobiose dehydrogenase [Hypoxylon haematostroma]